MSINSLSYFLILLLSPFILSKKGSLRKYSFLAISIVVLGIANEFGIGLWVSLGWIILPFILKKFITKRWILVMSVLSGFIYMNSYIWIFPWLSSAYLMPFKLFGLSYIVFRQIDYIFYEGNEGSLTNYLNYVISFYNIVAGPIERFEPFTHNIDNPSVPLSFKEIIPIFNRIVNGYLKVYLISSLLSKYADLSFHNMNDNVGWMFIFSILNVAYIYFNFSGYCDVVIGFARLANIELSENFNKPYLARDINDFWARQHITLTSWITDYIFTPFTYHHVSKKKLSLNQIQYLAFFITFLCAGLWHGNTVNYLVYGLLQAVGVCVVKMYNDYLKRKLGSRKKAKEFRNQRTTHIFRNYNYSTIYRFVFYVYWIRYDRLVWRFIVKFHHLGIACKDLTEFKNYIQKHFNAIPVSEVMEDKHQNAHLQLFETPQGIVYEGISGPVVTGYLKKRNYLYHTCYEVEDITTTIDTLQQSGSILISPPAPAPLFKGRKVCFLTSDIGLIELLEAEG